MNKLPKKLKNKLEKRRQEKAFRQLGNSNQRIDFSSNDYLGFSKSETIFKASNALLKTQNSEQNGATGSRLLSGNHKLYPIVEQQISVFHKSETALIFNSGYDANLGFFSCVPQRNDIIFYDEYCHASIRDGITMSKAKAFKFKHNDLEDLEKQMLRFALNDNHIYIVTESIFSMDGDSPNLVTLSQISKKHNANLIVDEAHALGVYGNNGNGLISQLNLEDSVFARTITFGKALGAHGAAILCNKDLKDYLINFSRPFIYTTALPPHSLATINSSYNEIVIQSESEESQIKILQNNIRTFKSELIRLNFDLFPLGEMSEGQRGFIKSNSAIHCCVISGNEITKRIAQELQNHGFDVKAILSPTVPKGKERLRLCLHSYNSSEEITKVLELLATFV